MMRRYLKLLWILVLFIIVGITSGIYFAPQFGFRIDTVRSGSMEPALKVGGVVITESIPITDIRQGDIVTFRSPNDGVITSHRVNARAEGSPVYFETKGDANPKPDYTLVPESAIIGEVVFVLPFVGYVANFIKTPFGFIVIMGVPAVFIVFTETRSILCSLSGSQKNKGHGLVKS